MCIFAIDDRVWLHRWAIFYHSQLNNVIRMSAMCAELPRKTTKPSYLTSKISTLPWVDSIAVLLNNRVHESGGVSRRVPVSFFFEKLRDHLIRPHEAFLRMLRKQKGGLDGVLVDLHAFEHIIPHIDPRFKSRPRWESIIVINCLGNLTLRRPRRISLHPCWGRWRRRRC